MVSPHLSWLDDVRPNPYADQLALGYRRLRFLRPLELEYRAYMLRDSAELKRIALVFALIVWLTFVVVDFWMLAPPLLYGVVAIRLGVAALLVVCGRLLLLRRHTQRAVLLSLACIGCMGLGAAAIIAIGHGQNAFFPYEGLLLVCIAAYFLVGLRLIEALTTCVVVVLAYVLFESLAGLPAAQLFNNLVFLFFGNLIGAVGCYLLELKSREHFLVSQLMRVLADQDSLTGLHNRRSFNRQLTRLWRQAQREQVELALLLCDVDHFKAYNDRYGHPAGDVALQQVGVVLREAARRPLDMAVRLGGEEFAVLLYGIGADEARQRGEVLRQALELLRIEHAGSQTAPVLTLSVGVACRRPGEGVAMTSLFEHADRALYEAKAFGRNQVVT
ncbi:GGDEF domain-containing protein [Aquipseudomonas ullengensis]|uniref:diguanylate cyclase n=1 Tax=Aquipseudomonas ullengensis TaxID=2759166 RepID=A0A7W4LKM9_9GAMM|nr:diguanylate cyclase [Pseudomonas ullengensis]MBB2494948.1 GGDEF domain-containing protein [Pseudomonas ullengensis]